MSRLASAREIFEKMPDYFAAENAVGVNASFQFNLSAEGGGQWYVTVADGKAEVAEGWLTAPTITVECAAADWVGIVNGDVNPMAAFMQGRLKVSGDLSHALKLQGLFRRPH